MQFKTTYFKLDINPLLLLRVALLHFNELMGLRGVFNCREMGFSGLLEDTHRTQVRAFSLTVN